MRQWITIAMIIGSLSGCGNNGPVRINSQVESGSMLSSDGQPPIELDLFPEEAVVAEPDTAGQLDPVATGLRSAPVPSAAIRTIALHPTRGLLAMGTGDGEIAIWDASTQQFEHEWTAHEHWVFDLEFDVDADTLVSAGGDNRTKLWSIDDWREVASFEDHQDDVHGAVVTPDGRWLVTGGDDTDVLVRNLKTGEVKQLAGHQAQVTSVAVHPDGKLLFSGSRDQTVRVWDLESFSRVTTLRGHQEDVLHLALSSSGRWLASASYDGTVKIWSTDALTLQNTISVSDAWVLAVTFSLDEDAVVTGSADATVREFDRLTGEEKWSHHAGSDIADLVALAEDDQYVVATSTNGLLFLKTRNDEVRVTRHVQRQIAKTPPKPITTLDYLGMHSALLHEQAVDDWSSRVGLLSIYGDEFTAYLLSTIHPESLPAPKREMVSRLKDQLLSRQNVARMTSEQVGNYWGRVAITEAFDIPIQTELEKWAVAQTRRWMFEQAPGDQQRAEVIATLSQTFSAAIGQKLTSEQADSILKDVTERLDSVFATAGEK